MQSGQSPPQSVVKHIGTLEWIMPCINATSSSSHKDDEVALCLGQETNEIPSEFLCKFEKHYTLNCCYKLKDVSSVALY